MDNNNHQATQQPTSHSQPQSTARTSVRPRASITETPADFVVQVEMPGVNRLGLELTFENGELTLVGHRANSARQTDGMDLVYRESRPVDFRRVFELDSSIDAAKISAGLDQGLLTLTLPKAETAKPRRIEINCLN